MSQHIHRTAPGTGSGLLDRLGFSVSTACAVHCVLTPLAITLLPAIGLGFLAEGWFELMMIAVAVTIAGLSLGSSYRLHRRLNPLMIAGSAAVLLIFNFFGHESHSELVETLHPYIAGAAGLMIAFAHRINMKLCRSCGVCNHDHAVDDLAHDGIGSSTAIPAEKTADYDVVG